MTDGVFVQESAERVTFRALPAPSNADIAQVAWQSCQDTLKLLEARGMWLEADPSEDDFAQAQPGLAELAGASVRGVLALGPRAGQRIMHFRGEAAREPDNTQPIVTPGYGFNLHAKRRISAHDRKGLEGLCRYLLRGPIAQQRLSLTPRGMVALELKRPYRDGTTHVLFEPLDFVGKLAAMVPPRRMHRTRFHGVFSSHAKLRSRVVPKPDTGSVVMPAVDTQCGHDAKTDEPTDFAKRRRLDWAKLMARVFELDVLQCPRCHSQMQRISFITQGHIIRKMLASVGMPADSPQPHPPKGQLSLACT